MTCIAFWRTRLAPQASAPVSPTSAPDTVCSVCAMRVSGPTIIDYRVRSTRVRQTILVTHTRESSAISYLIAEFCNQLLSKTCNKSIAIKTDENTSKQGDGGPPFALHGGALAPAATHDFCLCHARRGARFVLLPATHGRRCACACGGPAPCHLDSQRATREITRPGCWSGMETRRKRFLIAIQIRKSLLF